MLPLLLLPLTMGNDPEPFRVQNHMPAFEVRNRVPAAALPTDPNDDAPPGYQWQRRQGEDWKLVKVAAAPVVAAPRPFVLSPGSPSDSSSTPGTTARPAVSSPSRARAPGYSVGVGRSADPTLTLAPLVGSSGFTNCPPSG
jgi:hypothetical protein